MIKLTNAHRINVVRQQCVSYVDKQKRGIVLLIWEYRAIRIIYIGKG